MAAAAETPRPVVHWQLIGILISRARGAGGEYGGGNARNNPEFRIPIRVGHAVVTAAETCPAKSSIRVAFWLKSGMLLSVFGHEIAVPASHDAETVTRLLWPSRFYLSSMNAWQSSSVM
jgi:hypothetical protein